MGLSDEQPAGAHQDPQFQTSAGLPTQRLPPLPSDALRSAHVSEDLVGPGEDEPLRVAFKAFKSSVKSWDEMFREASAYATRIGRERLITISHSADNGTGVVAVWFWADWNDDPR